MAVTVGKIDDQADGQPDDEPRPRVGGQSDDHEKNARTKAKRRREPQQWRAKRPQDLRVGETQNKNANTDNRKRQQRADGNQFAEQTNRKKSGDKHGNHTNQKLRNPRRPEFWMHDAEN